MTPKGRGRGLLREFGGKQRPAIHSGGTVSDGHGAKDGTHLAAGKATIN